MIDLGKCKEGTAVLKLKTSISPKVLIQYFTLGQKIYIFYALKDAIDQLLGNCFLCYCYFQRTVYNIKKNRPFDYKPWVKKNCSYFLHLNF